MVSGLARVGVLVDPSAFIYAIAGLTIAHFDYQNLTNNTFFQPGERFWALGANVGGGIERKIDQNWSVRAEYRFTQFRHADVSNNFLFATNESSQSNVIQTRFENQMHVGRLGFSYQPNSN